MCERDREGDDSAECVAIENPEPVRSSDFDKMLAAGLIPTSIVRKGVGRDAELAGHITEHRGGRDFARFQRTARPSHGEQEHSATEPGGSAAPATAKFPGNPGERKRTGQLTSNYR